MSANESNVHICFLALRKRFYKDVSITEGDNSYEINLDGRKLKTPSGNLFKVKSIELAHAVKIEWSAQTDVIRPTEMHLTALANTSIDNPMRNESEALVNSLLDYVETDTLLFRTKEPEDIFDLQGKL